MSKSLFATYAAVGVVILTVVGYPLIAPVSVILDLPSRLVSVPFRAFVLLLSLVVIVVEGLMRNRFSLSLFCVVWWTFWGLYISRIFVDGFLNAEALRLTLSETILYAVGMSLIPASALLIKIENSILNRAIMGTIIMGSFGAVFNILLITSQQGYGNLDQLIGGRLESGTLNPISLSHLGVTVLILSAWMMIRLETKGIKQYGGLIICLLIGAGSVLAGASRGPLLALSLILPMIGYKAIKNLHKKNAFRLVGVVLVFLFGFAWLISNGDAFFAIQRMKESLFIDDFRMKYFSDGWNLFLENILLGAGIEPLGFYPHNLILESFMLCGIFSGLLFLSIVLISLAACVKLFFYCNEKSWISLLYVQYIIAAMFSGALYDSASMWICMTLVVSQSNCLPAKKEKM